MDGGSGVGGGARGEGMQNALDSNSHLVRGTKNDAAGTPTSFYRKETGNELPYASLPAIP